LSIWNVTLFPQEADTGERGKKQGAKKKKETI